MKTFPVGFVVKLMMMDWTYSPLVQLQEHPEFTELIQMDTVLWPRCFLWHGRLPAFAGNILVLHGPPQLKE